MCRQRASASGVLEGGEAEGSPCTEKMTADAGCAVLRQDGVDAPPEEERLGGALEGEGEVDLAELDPDLDADADLSFATMFAR